MRAVIYSRVSTKEQVSNLSLATQQKVCREYCEREGFSVAAVFVEEGESAKSARRTKLIEMLAYCRSARPRIDALVVHSLSRFSRDVFNHHQIRNALLASGTTLRSATETLDNSPSGKLVENLIAGVAQFENDVKSQRTVQGMQEANRLGRWTWTAPLGYLNGKSRSEPSLYPDPQRFELVRKAFDLVASGAHSKADALRIVAALGLRSRKGAKVSAQTFWALLRNPAYAGRLRAAKWGQEHRGDWIPVVSDSLFRQVQALTRRKGPIKNLPIHPDFPLRRFVRCGHCDRPLTGSHSRGRTGRYAYYHCAKCNKTRAAKQVVEQAFLSSLERLQPKPEYLGLFRAIVADCWNSERDSATALRDDVEKRIGALTASIDRLEQAFIFDRAIDAKSYRSQLQRLRDELTAAECELSDARFDQLEVEGVLVFTEHVLGNLASLWSGATPTDRMRLQTTMFPTGLVWSGSGFGTAVTNPAFSWLRAVSHEESCVASPTIPSWNQIAAFLESMRVLRDSSGLSA